MGYILYKDPRNMTEDEVREEITLCMKLARSLRPKGPEAHQARLRAKELTKFLVVKAE